MAGMLEGRTMLITGVSRGIGRAMARTARREGAVVVAHAGRNPATAAELRAEFPQRFHALSADLKDRTERAALFEEAVAAAGHIDVLVNNAGGWTESPVDDPDAWSRGWQSNLELNLQAPADLCRQAIAHFRGRGGGAIINVTSRSAHRGDDAEHLAYGAAKGGLQSLTKGIARGYGNEGVLAYAISPGWVATDISAHISPDDELLSGLPLGEITPASDVAELMVFLASGRSRHVTGATIDITGADYVR